MNIFKNYTDFENLKGVAQKLGVPHPFEFQNGFAYFVGPARTNMGSYGPVCEKTFVRLIIRLQAALNKCEILAAWAVKGHRARILQEYGRNQNSFGRRRQVPQRVSPAGGRARAHRRLPQRDDSCF